MTDRYDAFIVVLSNDLRDDDAEATINAIKQIKGVLDVHPHVGDITTRIAQTRARAELTEELWKVLYPDAR